MSIVIKTPLEQTINLLSACFHQYPELVMTILEEEATLKMKIKSSSKHAKNIDSLAKKYVKAKIKNKEEHMNHTSPN